MTLRFVGPNRPVRCEPPDRPSLFSRLMAAFRTNGHSPKPTSVYDCDVVCCYTVADAHWMPGAVESILQQQGVRCLVHLVNDDCPVPVDPAGQFGGEADVRLYRNSKSIGPYASFMRVFDAMESEFAAVQDADDISMPHRIGTALDAMRASGAMAWGGSMQQFVDRSNRDDESLAKEIEAKPVCKSGMKWSNTPHGALINGTMVVRRDAFEAVNGFMGWKCGADNEFTERLQSSGYVAIQSEEIVGLRRLHRSSVTHSGATGVKSPYRMKVLQESLARLPIYQGTFDPRQFGELDKHRSKAGTERVW